VTLTYALLVGVLFGVALYLLLGRSLVDKIFALILLGYAANLVVFGSGRLVRGAPPLLDGAGRAMADPLPQALVLTAIVIGFGLVSFTAVLIARLHQATGTDDLDDLEERPDEE
jgi:multicomponent Na+:H+ antiporter subunit C